MDAIRVSVWDASTRALVPCDELRWLAVATDRRDGILEGRTRLLACRCAKDAVHSVKDALIAFTDARGYRTSSVGCGAAVVNARTRVQ